MTFQLNNNTDYTYTFFGLDNTILTDTYLLGTCKCNDRKLMFKLGISNLLKNAHNLPIPNITCCYLICGFQGISKNIGRYKYLSTYTKILNS